MARARRRMGWKVGVAFVIVCVIIGFAVGRWGDAQAATPPAPQGSWGTHPAGLSGAGHP